MHKRGQELIEFALVLPVLLLIVLGGLGVATGISASTQVNQAAARAALDAASSATSGGCQGAMTAARTAVGEVVNSTLVSVTQISVDCDANGTPSSSSCSWTASNNTTSCIPSANPPFTPGNLVAVKVVSQVSMAVFGTGPSLTFSSTGAAIIPRSA